MTDAERWVQEHRIKMRWQLAYAGLQWCLLLGILLGVNCMYSEEMLHKAEVKFLVLALDLKLKVVLTWEII